VSDPNELVTEQRPPAPNDRPAVWDLVIADMKARDEEGRRKYGTPLQPFNGRDQLVDQYQELLDAVVYSRAALEERNEIAAELTLIYVDLDRPYASPREHRDALDRLSRVIARLIPSRTA
jgi:hypothetical protein